ncbi:hypothetical protein GE061_018990 [Apolygus lucorum]|uniref:Uncharacterized protein n=1 Tax=Apolygus lucorum TaxID=248454 RepID=A0A8S9X767_APOLU|nr:hypothetical protein GE061_018990 [Apolygus lucorum]
MDPWNSEYSPNWLTENNDFTATLKIAAAAHGDFDGTERSKEILGKRHSNTNLCMDIPVYCHLRKSLT